MELLWTFEYGPLTTVGALPQGAMFETVAGVRAIVHYTGGHDPVQSSIKHRSDGYCAPIKGRGRFCAPGGILLAQMC